MFNKLCKLLDIIEIKKLLKWLAVIISVLFFFKCIERRVEIKTLWNWKVGCNKGIVSQALVINLFLGLEYIKNVRKALLVIRSSKIWWDIE